jgi:hypothetical protein
MLPKTEHENMAITNTYYRVVSIWDLTKSKIPTNKTRHLF